MPNRGGDIGDEIGVANLVPVFHPRMVIGAVPHQSARRCQLAEPRAVGGLAVAKKRDGLFCRHAFTYKIQSHRRFEMVPRIDNAIFKPRDRAVRVLKIQYGVACAVEITVGQNAHFGVASSEGLSKGLSKYITILLPISGSARADRMRKGMGFFNISTSSSFL